MHGRAPKMSSPFSSRSVSSGVQADAPSAPPTAGAARKHRRLLHAGASVSAHDKHGNQYSSQHTGTHQVFSSLEI